MSFHVRRSFLTSALLLAHSVLANTQTRVPQIWNDAALADWATPLAKIQIRPSHYSSADYYAVPADNLRTYPVYLPDKEPPGYWEALQKRKPEPLVDFSKIRTEQDWSIAGARAFREIDSPLTRSDDPALIARARDPKTFANVAGLADGTVFEPRWVVTDRGVMLTNLECAGCHSSVTAERTIHYGGPPLAAPEGVGQTSVRNAFGLGPRALQRTFRGERMAAIMKRMFEVPWYPDSRMDQLSTLVPGGTQQIFFNPHGVIPRNNGSVFYGTRVADLQLLRYSRYIDATATHRMSGPEDVARYAALITGADSMDFGTHRFLSDAQRRVEYRYADEVLYAIGNYLLSLEPPKNPNPPAADLVARGKQIFQREQCGSCHPAPGYTTGKLTPADGFEPPRSHPYSGDIHDRSVGTEPGLALRTRKGTGFYKVPSLRGLWYRPRLLHDASIVSLEELFDAARLSPDYQRKGWAPPGAAKGAVPGLEFLTKLTPEEKTAIIAFLRTL